MCLVHIFKFYNEVDVFVCIVGASLEFIYKLVTRSYAGSKLYPVAQIKGLFSYGSYFLGSSGFEVAAHQRSALLLNARENISLNDCMIFFGWLLDEQLKIFWIKKFNILEKGFSVIMGAKIPARAFFWKQYLCTNLFANSNESL